MSTKTGENSTPHGKGDSTPDPDETAESNELKKPQEASRISKIVRDPPLGKPLKM